MPKLYTGAGDDGYTGLLGEGRIAKEHPRTEAIGAVDEAGAALGLARAASQATQTAALLLEAQRDLYNLMAELASTAENAARFRKIDASRVAWLEETTDVLGALVEMPTEFIVSGDSPAGAALALARTAVRRAERRVAELVHNGEVDNPYLLAFLNRLSSLCFVLELIENQAFGLDTPTLAKK